MRTLVTARAFVTAIVIVTLSLTLTARSVVHGQSSAAVSHLSLAYFNAQIKHYTKIPRFIAPGPGFNAKKAVRGKTLFVIPASSAVPFVQTIDNNMRTIANQVGLKYIDWPNQGQVSQWTQGMDAAINRKVSSIDLLAGIDPALLEPQIMRAKQAGIGTVVAHLYDIHQKKAANLAATVDPPYEEAGKLLADWTIAKTGGKVDTVVLTINEVTSTAGMVKGITTEMGKCGAGCHTTFLNFSIPELATKIQPEVQAALAKDPKINYVIALYDSAEAPFAVAGITAAGAQNRVKVVTYNGTPSVLKMVETGNIVQMDIGENLQWIAMAVMDQHMRMMAGLKPAANPHLPLRVFDKSNIRQTGTPPRDSTGFGSTYVAGYHALWGMG